MESFLGLTPFNHVGRTKFKLGTASNGRDISSRNKENGCDGVKFVRQKLSVRKYLHQNWLTHAILPINCAIKSGHSFEQPRQKSVH